MRIMAFCNEELNLGNRRHEAVFAPLDQDAIESSSEVY